ncbi:MAG: nuclear transport factor 2 family protein [Planctomycetota bacterium]
MSTFLEALSHNDVDAMRRVLGAYIQHNPNAPTGPEFILGIQPTLKEAGFSFQLHRIFVDGPFVVTHITFSNAVALGADVVVVFDIWKVIDGRIDEHWDCIEPLTGDSTQQSTRTNGPTEVVDHHGTETNKRIVRDFVSTVLTDGNSDRLHEYVLEGLQHHHNRGFDGPWGSIEKTHSNARRNTLHRVLGEGNFVLTQSEGYVDSQPYALYDLFRLENGKIAEHWDVRQEIPATPANDNGMF